jgi:anoctamin-10
LHNEVFNERWLQQWSKAQISIPDSQLSDIRDNLGDGVALYFEFLRYYFKALAFPAFVGLSTWLGGHYFSKLYSFTLVVWSILFVESWRIQERKLSVRWGTYGISKDDVSLRPGFKTEGFVTSPITGQQVPYSPWWLRESRMLAGIPAVLGFAVGLAVVICCIFSVESRFSMPLRYSQ